MDLVVNPQFSVSEIWKFREVRSNVFCYFKNATGICYRASGEKCAMHSVTFLVLANEPRGMPITPVTYAMTVLQACIYKSVRRPILKINFSHTCCEIQYVGDCFRL